MNMLRSTNALSFGGRAFSKLVHTSAAVGAIAIASQGALVAPVFAQTSGSGGALDEVVVTATRVATPIQDTPFSISAISGESLREEGLVDMQDLTSQVPGLLISQGSGDAVMRPAMRGMAGSDLTAGTTSPVATYIDDVYLPFTFGAASQMYDLSRVEVLRGPQGTLFGRNTTAGALLFYSQAPTDVNEGYLTLEGGGGESNRYAVEGALNQVLSDELSARASVRVFRRDGYVENQVNGEDLGGVTDYNARVQLAWQPNDDLSANLTVFGLRHRGAGSIYHTEYTGDVCAGQNAGPYVCDINGDPAPTSNDLGVAFEEGDTFEENDRVGATLRVTYDTYYGATLTSITGWQKGEFHVQDNSDGLAADYFHSRLQNQTSQFSQELRLATAQDAALRGVFGVFFQHDEIDVWGGFADGINTDAFPSAFLSYGPGVSEFFPFLSANKAEQETDAFAVFGSVTYDVTEQFSLIGGLRYSSESKDIRTEVFQAGENPAIPFIEEDMNIDIYYQRHGMANPFQYGPADVNFGSDTWEETTWDLTANYRFSDDHMIYAKAGTGFLSGGYTLPNVAPGAFNVLEPEELTAYEIGMKTDWLDGHLRINASVYTSEYTNMQVTTTKVANTVPVITRENAGAATINGAELEILALPMENLELSFTAGLADATFDEFITTSNLGGGPVNYAGNRLPFAPKTTASAGAAYTIPIGEFDLVLRTNWTYRDRVYFDANNDPLTSSEPAVIGDLRASLGQRDGGWRVTAYVDNVTDEEVRTYGFSQPDVTATGDWYVSYVSHVYAPLRTWGVQLDYTW